MDGIGYRRVIVHVWTEDGAYVGELYSDSRLQFQVVSDDEGHRERIRTLLVDLAKTGDWMEFRAADRRQAFEFPGAEWLAFAALLILPREGYRVHVIAPAVEAMA
jgi:hypothetical protein